MGEQLASAKILSEFAKVELHQLSLDAPYVLTESGFIAEPTAGIRVSVPL
jgi:hypothetical protein